MIKRIILLIVLIPIVALAQYDRPGSASAQFLKIGVSPRAAGMADAYISVVEGAEATIYNPAAIAMIEGTEFAFTHTEWFAGINHEFAAIAHTFDKIGSFGISFTALYTDEMKVLTPLQPNGTGETFYSSNYRLGLTYARFLTEHVTFGGTLNYINIYLYEGFSANAVSGDVSAFYVTNFRNFRFGMKIAHFGSEIKFVNEPYPLPVNFTFGASINAVEMEDQSVLISLSGIKPNDGKPLAQAGVEWNYNDMFFIRGGYRLNHQVETFAFGTGFQLGISDMRLRFDYSYSDFSLLGAAHRFGFSAGL